MLPAGGSDFAEPFDSWRGESTCGNAARWGEIQADDSPRDTVEVEAKLNDVVGTAYFLTGRVTLNGKLATRLDFACTVADPRSMDASS